MWPYPAIFEYFEYEDRSYRLQSIWIWQQLDELQLIFRTSCWADTSIYSLFWCKSDITGEFHSFW